MSLASQWDGVKRAWNDSTINESPGTRFGLMFDPLAYIGGDKYRDFINKTGDQANLKISKAIGTDDRGGWAANKPASTIGLLAASYFGGGAALGGLGGGGAGGGASGAGQGLGIFSNGGAGGMAGVGGGNAGSLAASHGIGGGAGIGSATSTGGFMGSMNDPRQWMQMAQQMPQGQQQQQEQPRPLQPVVIKGRVFWI